MDSNPEKRPHIEPHLWASVFEMLSLDLLQPYVKSIGLPLLSEPFMTGIRARIRDTGLDDEVSVKSVLRWVQSVFGMKFYNDLAEWAMCVYAGALRPDYILWEHLVRRDAVIELQSEGVSLFLRQLRERLMDYPEVVMNKSIPTSGWDCWLYTWREYDESRNPLDHLENILNYINFVKAWKEAEVEKPGIDLENFEWWGLQQGQRLGMPLERLATPGQWKLPPTIDR